MYGQTGVGGKGFSLDMTCNLISSILLLGISTQLVETVPSNSGNQFLVIFLENILDNSQLDLYITTNHLEVEVKVSAPLRLDISPETTIEVSKGQKVLVNIHKELNAVHTGICDHGILVESKEDITVQAYSQSTSPTRSDSTGGYMVLPISSLGTEYMVVGHCELFFCQFAVSSHVNTTVSVDLKISGTASFTYLGVSYKSGDILSVDISAYQILQIQVGADLTGTIVRSLHKVAVVVGSDWTPIQSKSNDGQGDYLVEQMPPVNTLGWTYVLVSFPGRSSEDLVDVVAAEENVVVSSSSGIEFSVSYRSKVAAKLKSGASVVLTSTGRLLIAHYTKSPENNGVKDTDPSMVLVPPVEQWKPSSGVVVSDLPPTAVTTSIVLYANASCIHHVSISHTAILASSWTKIDNTEYFQVKMSASSNVYWIESTDPSCKGFSGYIYGQSDNSAFALSIGGYLNILYKPTVSTSPVVSSLLSPSSYTLFISSVQSEDSSLFELYAETVETSLTPIRSLYSDIFDTVFTIVPAVFITSANSGATTSPSATSQDFLSYSLYDSTSNESSLESLSYKQTAIQPTPHDSTLWVSHTQDSMTDPIPQTTVDTTSELPIFSISDFSYSDFMTVTGVPPETFDESHTTEYIFSSMVESSTDTGSISLQQALTTRTGPSETVELVHMTSTSSVFPESSLPPVSQSNASLPSVTAASASSTGRTNLFICRCSCSNSEYEDPFTHKLEQIRKALTVDKTILSKTVRMKMSMPDERTSATAIGWGAIVVIVVNLFLITSADVLGVLIFIFNPKRKFPNHEILVKELLRPNRNVRN